jgi:tyrosinase
MESRRHSGRRRFLRQAASSLALATLPMRTVLGQSQPGSRLEWQTFRNTPAYASFIDTIGRMRANADVNDPNSLAYWANTHALYCPHSRPYFLAWHRGFLALFERQLQTLSGNASLMLPWWNFYAAPMLPWEFTDAASGNPLYSPRANANIRDGLSLAPFDASVFNFQRGSNNAFESLFEYAPHDACHNLMGGTMITMQAPLDPIFWIFHCNIDRLWHAWAYPTGKGMPWVTDAYWSGNHQYAPNLFLPRELTWYPGRLSYDYNDVSVPDALPPIALSTKLLKVQTPVSDARAATLSVAPIAPRRMSPAAKSLGGVGRFSLPEQSASARIRMDAASHRALHALRHALHSGAGNQGNGNYRSLELVLDDVSLVNLGSFGGYFYQLYLNLPESSGAPHHGRLLGTLGPFEIAAAAHHGRASLRFAASEALARLDPAELGQLTVSFLRVNGANHPKGESVAIGEMRIEISTEEPWDKRRPAPIPPGSCYC